MKPFEHYFSSKNIVLALCKLRIKHAKKKHKVHLLRDISLHDKSMLLFRSKHNCPMELKDMLPTRRSWLKPSQIERSAITSSEQLRVRSLYKTIVTTHIKVQNQEISPPGWYLKLQVFIKKIQYRATNSQNSTIQKPVVNPVRKDNVSGVCRPISLYNLEDRLVIGFTSRYFTDLFDPYLKESSFAFRSTAYGTIKTHHDTIERIINYRALHRGKTIFVAEGDLEKFFDTINHQVIHAAYAKFKSYVSSSGGLIDDNAEDLFKQYLLSYSFNNDVLVKNGTSYFVPFRIVDGHFEWPVNIIEGLYDGLFTENIGIPQGGALSCLIANIVLHSVDEYVEGDGKDNNLLYLRFCDDMVILHTDKNECVSALNRYNQRVEELKLLMHKPEFILEYGKDFWKKKSKRPYPWARKANSKENVPWLSFVGYQINHNGLIRVRKKSLKKEIHKQKSEMKEVLVALGHNKNLLHKINDHSRKSKKQQHFALHNRLISMSVGRMTLYNHGKINHGLCWTNGFKCITSNPITRTQLRQLDRSRRENLQKFNKKLQHLIKASEGVDNKDYNYFGHPFSYHGYLK